MKLKELEELKSFNELDMLYKIIEIAEVSKKRVEKMLGGNKTAGVDIRRTMQDIRLLAEIIRDETQRRYIKSYQQKNSKIVKAIENENIRMAKEEIRIKKIEEKRIAREELKIKKIEEERLTQQ